METITIQVEAELAQAYRAAEPQQQQNPNSFNDLVKQMREEAAANGLTAEILAELLEV
ncbi:MULTISPECIES: hypothetical protein [unclassified Roseofilum]|uniref:hypothetical protein n=1 Tax=unclassified Roseofilum TaxID=2620099 RepID=UPI001B0A4C28|nr:MULTISPECIES: hypothetical protein [unclassified Roseofilum]MBP0011195.1 hypothetical protein [Roseofilum sp. Belize Diploria]MBP0035637.1 hypothetical protein [Roseofilum sp. Belize BBD 4]